MNILRRYIREILEDTTGACSSCGSEPGCNIDCDQCMTMTEHKAAPTKKAACVLIMSDDGKILAVSRKDNPGDFGMPGGKVDPGETPEEAASRELKEETGLTVRNLRQVFSMFDGDSTCYTFIGEISGEISTPEAGVVRWVNPDVLLGGSFAAYNKALLSRFGFDVKDQTQSLQ